MHVGHMCSVDVVVQLVDDALPIVDAGERQHEQLVRNTPTDTEVPFHVDIGGSACGVCS